MASHTMASQLALGRKLSRSTLSAEWMKENNDRGFDLLLSQNIASPVARCFSVCASAPTTGWKAAVAGGCCKAHVRAKGPTAEEMTIISIDTNHTCKDNLQPGEEVKGRKRNYMTKDIDNINKAMAGHEPTRKKEGNAKQLMEITKSATGFNLKKSAAFKAIREKSHDTLEAQIGQHMLMPSVFEAHQASDPSGTYFLEHSVCPWDHTRRQFKRCYVCLSFAKHFWSKAGIKLFVCDGTFTKMMAFKHILLTCVTFDGNNNVMTVILALAIVDVENSDDWVWFKECLEDDFPGSEVWMSDADKGIESRAFTLSVSQVSQQSQDDGGSFERSRCARHLSVDCNENSSGKMSEDDKLTILNLARSRAREVYKIRLEAIRECKEEWADCLDARKEQFVSCAFLEKGISRHGKVTSNAVENTNSALMAERCLPIMHMLESIIKCQKDKCASRKEQAASWIEEGKTLTLCAEEQDAKIGDTANRRTIQSIQSNHPIYKANVAVGANSGWSQQYIEVEVNAAECTGNCPCKNYEEAGAQCHHAKALLLQLGRCGVGEKWCHRRFHSVTYRDSHSGDIPGVSLAGGLRADSAFLPPEHKQQAGRPKKKRRPRECLRKTDVRRVCPSCGLEGHFSEGCTKPSAECRVTRHLGKALKCCEKVGAVEIEEN